MAGEVLHFPSNAAASMQALVNTGYCWHSSYFPSLARDEEFEFQPKSHWRVEIILSLEESVEGWGETFDDAAAVALRQIH